MTPKQKRDDEIYSLEGELMLAAFHGYSAPHIEKRLLQLLEERDNDESI